MAMFTSVIQSLSQMAIQESGVNIPETADNFLLEDIKTQLDNMTPLTIDEMHVLPEMIPVKLSKRLGKYLIEAEDLSRFMITNGIVNIPEAIGYILEASDLEGQYHNVAIVIDEGSILDEMDDLGYVVSDFNLQTPPKGLGLAMVGKQRDFAKLRNIANTKQLMDLLTGRYGLPLVKRNYRSVGLLNGTVHEATEDVELKAKRGEQVLHEEDPKKQNKSQSTNFIPEEQQSGVREEYDDYVEESFNDHKPMLGTGRASGALGHALYRARQPKPQNNNRNPNDGYAAANGQDIHEDAMTPHDHHIAWMRAVARGEIDIED